ncbi:MAG: hypothetical protein HC898_07725 [Phycisphaerales bacterium]|nr:hypothetical protein [Phycisphaerales bacterium]
MVLTQDGLPLRDPAIRDTLFDDRPAADPEEALWLEVKTVSQFTRDGPFPRYSAELLAPVPKDVKKLWYDSRIRHSALLLVLFTAEQSIAEHDLAAWQQRCLDRKYPITTPAIRGFLSPSASATAGAPSVSMAFVAADPWVTPPFREGDSPAPDRSAPCLLVSVC